MVENQVRDAEGMTQADLLAKIEALPDAEKVAVYAVLDNAYNGASWGFVDQAFFDAYKDVLSGAGFKVWKTGKRYLVQVNPQLFGSGLSKVSPRRSADAASRYKEYNAKAIEIFRKKLESWVKKAQNGGSRSIRMGIFSDNSTPTATAQDGQRIDAFQLTFDDLGALLCQAQKHFGTNFKVQVSSDVYVTADVCITAGTVVPSAVELKGARPCRDFHALEVELTF